MNSLNVPILFINSMGSHNVCTDSLYQYCVLYLAWWWVNEPKHIAEFLILITNIYWVYWLNKLLYYCKTQRDGSYQRTQCFMLVPKLFRINYSKYICKRQSLSPHVTLYLRCVFMSCPSVPLPHSTLDRIGLCL